MDFLVKYQRTYASKSDMGSRFNIFAANYDRIKEHNAQNPYVEMEIN